MRNSCRRQTHLNTTLKQQTCSPKTDPAIHFTNWFTKQIIPNRLERCWTDGYPNTDPESESPNVLMLKPKSKVQQYSVFIGLQYTIVNSIFVHYQCLMSSSGGQTKYYMLCYLTFML